MPRISALALLLLVLAGPSPLAAQEPYILGSEDDPQASAKKSESQAIHAKATLLRTLHYSDHFSVGLVALSPDGQELAAVTRASREGLKAWETATGVKLQLPPTPDSVGAVAYSHDMARLAVSVRSDPLSRDQSGGVFLYDMKSGRLVDSVGGGEDARSMAFSPDGSVLVVATPGGILSWQLDRPRPALESFLDMRRGAEWLSFASQGTLYVGADGGGLILRVSLADGQVLKSWNGAASEGSVAISPDGSLVARSRGDRLDIHRLRGGDGGIQTIEIPSTVSGLAWGASGDLLAAATTSGDVLLYRLEGVAGLPSQARSSPAPPTSNQGIRVARPPDDRSRSTKKTDRERLKPGDRSNNTGPRPAGPAPRAKREQVLAEVQIRILDQTDADPRNSKSMKKALSSRDRKLVGCWNKALRKKQPVAGRLVIELSVTPVGEGRSISEPIEDTIGNEDLVDCVSDRLRSDLFGSGLGSADIELTLLLRVITPP